MKDILAILSKSKKPISRDSLAARIGVSDRELRKQIQALREQGHPICSDSHGSGGYHLARSDADLDSFLRQYESHATHILTASRAIRRRLSHKGQEEMTI